MTKKKSSLVARVFTWVITAALVILSFIPTIVVHGDVVIGNDRTEKFATSVSVCDVLSVAFMSDEAREDKLAEITKEYLKSGGEKTNNKQYVLLTYFTNDTDDAVLGISARSWLVITSVMQILLYLALAAVAINSYMTMHYDNVSLPKVNKIFALIAGVLGVLLSIVFMFLIKDKVILDTYTRYNFFGYLFLALSVYLPLHVLFVFKDRTSYMKSKKKK